MVAGRLRPRSRASHRRPDRPARALQRAQIDASSSAVASAPGPAPQGRPRDERGRPAVRVADHGRRTRRRRRLHGHGDEPVAAASDAVTKPSVATSSSSATPTGRRAGRLALVGMGMDPGLSDVFAEYAAKNLFDEIDEVHVRDGGDLSIPGYAFAPVFSIWTTIEECLNPPVIWSDGELAHDGAVQRSGEVPVPGGRGAGRVRQRGARRGAARPALATGRQARHLQVRPGRRLHRQAEDHPRAGHGPHRQGARQGRRGRAARRAGRDHARSGQDGRQDGRAGDRGHVGHRAEGRPSRARSTSTR